MGDFEREVVHCFNRYFAEKGLQGFAYRLKQQKFNMQYVDVLVDSLDPKYYLSVECKSLQGKKVYFSQHFHADKHNVHQVDGISAFMKKTGRRGYLAVEFRPGPGKANEAYLVPWEKVLSAYGTCPGISIDECRAEIPLQRSKEGYTLLSL